MQSEELYRKYAEGRHWEDHPTVYAETFSRFLKDNGFGGLVVDAGCGNGRDVNVFKQSGFDAVGIDCSEKEVEASSARFPALKFEAQNVESLEFRDGSVGAFFMINVIHYVDRQKSIAEIHRTLKPGGYLFIHFNIDVVDKDGKVDYHHDEDDILALVSGFRILRKNIFERADLKPVKHTHRIMELILQKQ